MRRGVASCSYTDRLLVRHTLRVVRIREANLFGAARAPCFGGPFRLRRSGGPDRIGDGGLPVTGEPPQRRRRDLIPLRPVIGFADRLGASRAVRLREEPGHEVTPGYFAFVTLKDSSYFFTRVMRVSTRVRFAFRRGPRRQNRSNRHMKAQFLLLAFASSTAWAASIPGQVTFSALSQAVLRCLSCIGRGPAVLKCVRRFP